ncbi:MAG: metallophosphoesterase [Salibacteraceae bacterium]
MRTEILVRVLITSGILLLLDLYVYKGIRVLTSGMAASLWRNVIHTGYWTISIGLIVWMAYSFVTYRSAPMEKVDYRMFFFLFGITLTVVVPKLLFGLFHLVEDIVHLVRWVAERSSEAVPNGGSPITRIDFLTKIGAVLAVLPFSAFIYGMVKGRFNFRVIRKTLAYQNLPAAFDGLKVVQLSDMHLGSFFENRDAVQPAIKMINDLEPDVILFTGDLVNNYAQEAEPWVDVFKGLKASVGKFSVLGNHDYGDYVAWSDVQSKINNLDRVKQANRDMGFQLLLNESVVLERNGDKIGIAGVENWGLPPFPQHGDLKKALSGIQDIPFQVLMSHDPSHWDAQVLKKSKVDLTLSGHTHGMQFGVEIGGFQWSPVKFKYPRWAGLYEEGRQHLYVNRGFGYIGYPGRVGISPEITLLELRSEMG